MKKILALLLVVVMTVFMFAACNSGTSEGDKTTGGETSATTQETGGDKADEKPADEGAASGEKFKVGFAFYNLSNPVWAEVVEEAKRYGESLGMEVTYVDAGQDSSVQVSQIENFIQSGMDAICILAIDPTSVEDVAKKAMDAGIIVTDYSRGLENCYTTLTLDPIKTGTALVELAAKWIREKYGDNEFEWAHLDIPTVEVGVIQGQQIEKHMKELFPNSKLVANAATLTVEQGQKNTENILQAHPNLRVILSQSAGGGVGGNEAIKAAIDPSEYDDYGLFSIDATEQEVLNIINGDPQKGSISLGGGALHGRMLIDSINDLRNGKEVPKIVALPTQEVTKENAQQFYDEVYGKK